MKEKDIFPLTIVKDRYTGTYSGGRYTAWNMDPCELPRGIDADDVACAWFWDEDRLAGRGATAQEAIDDLCLRMERWDAG